MEVNVGLPLVREGKWLREDKDVLHMLIGVLKAPDLRFLGCVESHSRRRAYAPAFLYSSPSGRLGPLSDLEIYLMTNAALFFNSLGLLFTIPSKFILSSLSLCFLLASIFEL